MKKCPYCSEEILSEAIKCRFCGSELTVPENMKICPKCQEEIHKGALTCPHCRANLTSQEYPTGSAISFIGGVIGVLIYYFRNGQGHFNFIVLSLYISIGALVGFFIGACNDTSTARSKRKPKSKTVNMALIILLVFLFFYWIVQSLLLSNTSTDKSKIEVMKNEFAQNRLNIIKAVEKNPKNPEAYKDRGSLYLSDGNLDKALADYSKAIEINPNDGEAYFERAGTYFEKHEYDKAWQNVGKAKALGYQVNPDFLEMLRRKSAGPPEQQALERGWDYSDKHMYDEAIAEFNNTIQANPNSAEAYYFRADAYVKKNNFDKAISDYTKATEINPEYGDAYYNRALAYLAKGESDKSREDYNKAKALGHKVDPKILELINQPLSVGIIFTAQNGRKAVIINGKTCYEGDAIGNAKIEKIGGDYIEIIINSQKKNVKVGDKF